MFNVFMANMIIVSKSVSRECRAFLLGVAFACGAFGAFTALTVGQLLHDKVNHEAVFILEVSLCLLFIIAFCCLAKKEKFNVRQMTKHSKIGRSKATQGGTKITKALPSIVPDA